MRYHYFFLPAILSIGVSLMSGCGPPTSPSPSGTAACPQVTEERAQPVTLELTSPAFAHEDPIPERYTWDGEDISPPLPARIRFLEWVSTYPQGRVRVVLPHHH